MPRAPIPVLAVAGNCARMWRMTEPVKRTLQRQLSKHLQKRFRGYAMGASVTPRRSPQIDSRLAKL